MEWEIERTMRISILAVNLFVDSVVKADESRMWFWHRLRHQLGRHVQSHLASASLLHRQQGGFLIASRERIL